jgi:Rod binding domain-containing protein
MPLPLPLPASGAAALLPGSPLASKTGGAVNSRTAQQFEQLLIRQLLTQARAAGSFAQSDDEQTSQGYLALMDDHLSEMISSAGGLGVARAMMQQVNAAVAFKTAGPSPTIPATRPTATEPVKP